MKRLQFAFALFSAASLVATAPALAQQPTEQEKPAGRTEQGVWVPEGSTLAEVLEQQAANKAQAEAAKQHAAANQARLAAYEQAQVAYQAELARVEERTRAIDAEAARVAAAHEAAMAKWRADVEACQDGDDSRCAPKSDD